MFRFANSHAYPGCRVTIDGTGSRGQATAEFSDGSVSSCAYARTADGGIRVTVGAYTTRRRTAIAKKTWLLVEGADGTWKVARRA
ncbi:MAG: hypothetical protein AB7M05_00135 [Alphaproteobacteria bacterium]